MYQSQEEFDQLAQVNDDFPKTETHQLSNTDKQQNNFPKSNFKWIVNQIN